MYLLQLTDNDKLNLVKHDAENVPAYAILSHTWGAETDELTFQDVRTGQGREKVGFAKVRFCGEQAKQDGYSHFWVDTCCIDKTNNVELSEAINSMFRWYKRASKCYVYLEDVPTRKRDSSGQSDVISDSAFRNSRWFTRGWTLQELLAPSFVQFFSKDGDVLGDKTSRAPLISTITGIPVSVLQGESLSNFQPSERLRWAVGRQTTKKEDKAYCLLGIFNVFLSPIYGEQEHAFERLQEAISKRWNPLDSNLIKSYWAESPTSDRQQAHDESSNATISEHRKTLMSSLAFNQMDSRRSTIKDAQRTTCEWLLKHPTYVAWNDPQKQPGVRDILWINGKPGAGKSTLMKFAQAHAKKTRKKFRDEILVSFFFNARGEELEKTTLGMYRSILYQLLQSNPDLQSILDDVDAVSSSPWTIEMLQTLFTTAVADLGKRRLKCFIDALDECDEQQVRDMVTLFEDLGESALEGGTQLCICFASRHYPEIRINKGLSMILETETGHSEDLTKFIRRRLDAGNGEDEERIRNRIKEKSNGVFMWAVLVVDILNKEYRSGRMWEVRSKLEEIPERLSDLFKDMLRRDRDNMDDLLLCLQWILFAKRPLTHAEFYFAMVAGLDPARLTPWDQQNVKLGDIARFVVASSKGLAELTVSDEPTVQFIHESVKDFLIKDGGLCQLWPQFHGKLDSFSHDRLKQCCQRYLAVDMLSLHWADRRSLAKPPSSERKNFRDKVTKTFPFIQYASGEVLYHANMAAKDISQEDFLKKFDVESWSHINNALERYENHRYGPKVTLLYIAAERNYSCLIESMPTDRRWDRIPNERYGYPIVAAFANGQRDSLQTLLKLDGCTSIDDIRTDPGFGRACEVRLSQDVVVWAATNQNWSFIEFLLTLPFYKAISAIVGIGHEASVYLSENNSLNRDRKARKLTKSGGREEGLALGLFILLNIASSEGREKICRLVIDATANMHATGIFPYGRALEAAARNGHTEIVQMLLDAGARAENFEIPPFATPCDDSEQKVRALLELGIDKEHFHAVLYEASEHGHQGTVRLLLDVGMDPDSLKSSRYTGSALGLASENGHAMVVMMLLNAGASANLRCRRWSRNALVRASDNGHLEVVRMLIDAGANPNAVNAGDAKRNGTALGCASKNGHVEIVSTLLNAGATANTYFDYLGRNALGHASYNGHLEVVRMLLGAGAHPDAVGYRYNDTALECASRGGHIEIVRMLLDAGASPNFPSRGINALGCASHHGHVEIVKMLLDAGASVNSASRENALVFATCNGHVETVRMLLAARANTLPAKMPLDASVESRLKQEIRDMLRDAGINFLDSN